MSSKDNIATPPPLLLAGAAQAVDMHWVILTSRGRSLGGEAKAPTTVRHVGGGRAG